MIYNNNKKDRRSIFVIYIMWLERHENQLNMWVDKCKIKHWLHCKSSDYYKIRNNLLIIPPPILSLMVITKLFVLSDDLKSIFTIIDTIIGLLVLMLTTTSGILNYGRISEQHLNISKNYKVVMPVLLRKTL